MSKYRMQAILFVFVAFMLGCNEYMIVGVLPDVASEYHSSLSSLGYLVTMFAIIYAVFTPIITSLANRWQRHHVLLTLMVIFFIGNTWTAMATNYTSLLLSRMLTASVAGAIAGLVKDGVPVKNGLAWYHGFLLGSVLPPLLGCR